MTPIRTVAIGSTNPVKLAAAQAVIARIDSSIVVRAIATPSGVAAQPWGDEETQRGAENRARAARESADADLGIGIEGGVVEQADGLVRTCAWAVIIDRHGQRGLGGSLAMLLPAIVVERLRAGEELGHAIDVVAQTAGTGRGQGVVGIFTASLIDRQRAYEPLVTYALAPWLASDYFGTVPPYFTSGL